MMIMIINLVRLEKHIPSDEQKRFWNWKNPIFSDFSDYNYNVQIGAADTFDPFTCIAANNGESFTKCRFQVNCITNVFFVQP